MQPSGFPSTHPEIIFADMTPTIPFQNSATRIAQPRRPPGEALDFRVAAPDFGAGATEGRPGAAAGSRGFALETKTPQIPPAPTRAKIIGKRPKKRSAVR